MPQGSYGTGFGFTGEYTDANDLLYLRARYYAPGMGVFTALDPWEGIAKRPMSLNGYSWVEGNVPNGVDPTGMVFWGFPSRARKEFVLNPNFYGMDTSYTYGTGRCHGLYDGVWVARWLEESNRRLVGNEGLWNTLIEFPARGKRVDALVLEDISFLSNPARQVVSGNGYVYEFEPISLTSIAKGYKQVGDNLTYMRAGNPPHSHTGNLPVYDFWNDIVPRSVQHLGEPYDWTQVNWELAPYLSPTHGRGPVRVDPNSLGGTNIPEAYWAIMPVDGLVLHVSECELRRRGEETTAAAAGLFLLTRYNGSRDDYNDRYGGGNMPPPANIVQFPSMQPGGEVEQPAAAAFGLGQGLVSVWDSFMCFLTANPAELRAMVRENPNLVLLYGAALAATVASFGGGGNGAEFDPR